MESFQGPLELEGRLVEVVVRDRRSRVHADIKGLGCREDHGNGALDRTLGGLLAVDPEHDHSPRGFSFRRIIKLFNQAIFGGTHLFVGIFYVKYNFM